MRRRTIIVAAVGILLTPWGLCPRSAGAAPLPPQMHTVAGTGSCVGAETAGGPCDNVPATSVPIGKARSVAELPGGGFIYVDSQYNLVREVSVSGTVKTVAGNGTTTDIDGGRAVDSGLNGPVAVAPLATGGFLITEYNGSVVRRVSSSGTISTIAGTGAPNKNNTQSGPATSVGLNYPADAEPTPDGSVLIADTYNNRIRELSPSGAMSTIAGGGACDDAKTTCDGMAAGAVIVNRPVSVSPIQGVGGYLFAEYDASAIRKVSETSQAGTFTTVAGIPGSAGFGGDGGSATSAQLSHPEQVVSADGGGFLIADSGNERIRQVSPTGTIATIAGNGFASYAGDGGAATSASLESPAGVSPTPDGTLLIADADNGAIRAVTIPPTTTIALTPSAPNGTNGWYITRVHATVWSVNAQSTNCELDPPAAPPVFDLIAAPCLYSNGGADITGDGPHTLYAASVNGFGDKEVPVSVSLKIDTTPPTLTCSKGMPRFTIGDRHAFVTASVSDQIVGPALPTASAPVETSVIGSFSATVFGANNAGGIGQVRCSYSVLPKKLTPTPTLKWSFSVARGFSSVTRLVVTHVPAGAVVNLTCRGTGCPLSAVRNLAGKRRGRHRTVDLTRLFGKARLAAATKLTVTVTKPNTIGRAWVLTTRASGTPSHRIGCVLPGSSTFRNSCSKLPGT